MRSRAAIARCRRSTAAVSPSRRNGSPRDASAGRRKWAGSSRWPIRSSSSARTRLTPALLLRASTSAAGRGRWIQRMRPAPPGLFRRLAGAGPLVLRSDVGMGLDVLPVALVPPIENRAGDEDGGEGAGDDADQEGERKSTR